MKHLSLILALFCCFVLTGKAATLSGTVSYSGSAGAAPSKKVYLRDSNMTTYAVNIIDSTTTSSTGAYSFTLTPSSLHAYGIQCNACGFPSYSYYGYFTTSLTINLTLSCGTVYITDTVRNSSTGSPVFGQKVYISNATSSYKDSSYTNSGGVVTFGVPPGVPTGTLTVSTNACGLQTQSFTYTGSGMAAPTLLVCVSSAVISGTFTNISTSLPIAYYPVMIVDSSSGAILYSDSTITNAIGAYSFTLPAGTPSGIMIAYTYACGLRISNSASFTGSNLTLNLSGCATGTATVSGTVTNAVTSTPIAGQKVYLRDSISTTVVYRDSTVTNSSGSYSFTMPPTVTSAYVILTTASCSSVMTSFWTYTGISGTVNFNVYGSANTISGTVYTHTGAPASGATLQLFKSGVGWVYATANSAGNYSLTIPCTWAAGSTTLYMYPAIANCGTTTRTIAYSGSSISGLIDTVCYLGISGIVSKHGSGVAANAKVYLVDEYYDSSSISPLTTLTAIDSTTTNASGFYSFDLNAQLWPYHTFYAKAALQPSDPDYSNFLPTYHDSALIWSSADTIKFIQWQNHATDVNISLRAGSNTGGPAFIGGNVLMGANKQAGVGDPLPGKILILTTSTGQAVAYTYSDATGQFSFPNLPYGNYLLSGDVWGKDNPALTVSVSQGNGTVNNIVFEENSTSFEGHYNSLSVGGPRPLDVLRIYPNPVKDYVGISGLNAISGSKNIMLRNGTGALVGSYSQDMDVINTKGLPAGLYLLQIQTSEGMASFRFVKE